MGLALEILAAKSGDWSLGPQPKRFDPFRGNLHITCIFNNVNAHGIPPKHLYLRVAVSILGEFLGDFMLAP